MKEKEMVQGMQEKVKDTKEKEKEMV